MILICGDAMIDQYWFGDVTRISPEAPVPVLAYGRVEDRQGGAANVARNAAAMGAKVSALFSRSFQERPVMKIRLIARTQQIARVDFDHPQEAIDLRELRGLADMCSVAVLSDYAKGSLPDPAAAIAACQAGGAKVLVDPKGNDASRYEGADLLKPNHFEMQALAGEWRSEADLIDRARAMCERHRIGAILMTRGDRGMTLFDGDNVSHLPGRRLDLCDVSGAGDTAIAALAVGLDAGMPLLEAAALANKAAGIAVSRFGTSVVQKSELFS